MSAYTPKDKLFIAAAKKLGTLSDDQLKDCLKVALERRKIGVDKDLGDVALDKGYLSTEKYKAIATLMSKAAIVKKGDSEGSKPELAAQPASRPAPPPPAPAPAAAAPVDLVDGYTIADRLGEGAMATVYRARHK